MSAAGPPPTLPPVWENPPARFPEPEGAPVLSYATPVGKGPRVWAGVALLLAALGLIFLGGCFMIGILFLNDPSGGMAGPPPVIPPKTTGQIILECTLYCLAFACFGSAVYIFGLAIAWLRRIVFC